MKKLIFLLFFVALLSSCKSTVVLNQDFYNNKPVGIVLVMDQIGLAKEGSQGFLDMALTPGNRFYDALDSVDKQIEAKINFENQLIEILNAKSKPFVFIEDFFDYDYPTFNRPKPKKKYSKIDYSNMKLDYDIEEVWIIFVDYGLLVSYYGFIELEKKGYAEIQSEIISTTDNSILQSKLVSKSAKIKGNWKKGENFSNLRESVMQALDAGMDEIPVILNGQ